MRKGQGAYANQAALPASERLRDHQGYTIAITPTADMPAPVSEVTVSGEIRARMIYNSYEIDGDDRFIDLDGDSDAETSEYVDDPDYDTFDITTRARLRVDGRTETAIGEVGGTIRLEGTRDVLGSDFDDDHEVVLNIGWGYWQMTPELQLGAGYWDSLAAIQAGWDWNGEPSLIGLRAGPTNHSVSQFRLTYSSGGFTAAVSLEDNDRNNEEDHVEAVFPSIAGHVAFDSGSFLITASGIYQADEEVGFVDTEDDWFVGAGAIIRLSDMFRLEGAAGIGEGYTSALYFTPKTGQNDYEYWNASLMAVISFAEAWRLELGAAYLEFEHEDDELIANLENAVEEVWTVGASAFWDPVDQLTLGVGVGVSRAEAAGADADAHAVTAGFGAWFRF